MIRKSLFTCILVITLGAFVLAGSYAVRSQTHPEGIPPIPETAQFDIDLADIYAEIFPDSNEIFVICTLWLVSAYEPVILKMEGNVQHMSLSSKSQNNISYVYKKPYIYLDNLTPGAHQVTFIYTAKHDGITSPGLISTTDIRLDAASWWYPRNVASDAHQAILNIEGPPDLAITSNGTLFKNVSNNYKQLRQFVLTTATSDGLTLD
ncbi:MAG: hypothetical protein Kow0029_19250 [Candidatus Rifleibacteriota bacterium]